MKIIFAAGADDHLYLFERNAMLAFLRRGDLVYALAPAGPYLQRLARLGIIPIVLPLRRQSLNPFSAFSSLIRLIIIFYRLEPDALLTFTAKMNILGNLAARLMKIPVISHVSGLGGVFSKTGAETFWRKTLQWLLMILYRFSFQKTTRVIFLNNDDAQTLNRKIRVVRHEQILVTRGPGVNLKKFSPERVSIKTLARLRRELNISAENFVVLMASRLLFDKGVSEYCEAAKLIRNKYPRTVFLLAGAPDPESHQSVPPEFFTPYVEAVRRLGFRTDIRELLALADIFVLPSYYGEGLPQVLLEALAMGKPLVTTDQVGCRETVQLGVNGFLATIRNSSNLAEKIGELLAKPEQRRAFGLASRKLASEKFDEKTSIELIQRELDSATTQSKHYRR